MRVSKRTDYALRALFTLVDHYGGAPIPIRELARRNDVPKRFLEQIMLSQKSHPDLSVVRALKIISLGR
jgi:DNA-binding IscR family transcriptional regulator